MNNPAQIEHALVFEAPAGQRLHRFFMGVTNFDGLWWSYDEQRWVPTEGVSKHRASTHAPCRTLRAFKRMLRKHPNIAGKAILVSRYEGYNVYSRVKPSKEEA